MPEDKNNLDGDLKDTYSKSKPTEQGGWRSKINTPAKFGKLAKKAVRGMLLGPEREEFDPVGEARKGGGRSAKRQEQADRYAAWRKRDEMERNRAAKDSGFKSAAKEGKN